jgi:AAA domain-containing protein/nuclease-like protein
MIYPSTFPLHKKGHPEEYVFNALKRVSDQYDIFYERKFIGLTRGEKNNYEIDFIVAKPSHAILLLEVKGGLISFVGSSRTWYQNGKPMQKNPVDQVTVYWKSLMSRYAKLSAIIPFEWALVFPESEKDKRYDLPASVSETKVIDRNELGFIKDYLKATFDDIDARYPPKNHVDRVKEYEKFKSSLIRDYGFVRTLSTKFIEEENRFVELTEQQHAIFNAIRNKKRLFVQGVAGSGKTLIALNIAHEALDEGKKVLFLCFNRTLANVINKHFEEGASVTVNTFHSYAEDRIDEVEANWFQNNNTGESDWFDNDVPIKFADIQDVMPKSYDLIIIDEGQDFKEFWFEIIFQEIASDGTIIVFADFDQDIFGRYDNLPMENPLDIILAENCRNTKAITHFINDTMNMSIANKKGVPEGDPVEEEHFHVYKEMIKRAGVKIKHLIQNDGLTTQQIVIIVNKSLNETTLREFDAIGSYKLEELDNDLNFKKNTIHFTTPRKFKGLDSDVVFMFYVPNKQDSEVLSNKMRYVQVTRAKHKLFFYTIDE